MIFERACFNARFQSKGELIEQFITALYRLLEHCEYGELKEEMIRDRLIVGICDSSLSERLQMDDALTLEKTKKLVRQREAFKKQQSFLKKEECSLEHVKQKPKNTPTRSKTKPSLCSRCGKSHARDHCPARDVTCFKCNCCGHFGKMCFSKTVAMVSEDTFNADDNVQTESSQNYLDAISDDSDHSVTAWYIRTMVNNHEVVFKVDTGAEVTAISKEVYDAIG